MIERIGTPKYLHVSQPCKEVLLLLGYLRCIAKGPITVAEIGVGQGATSVEIVKLLRTSDSFHFFSFEDTVRELYADLRGLEHCKCKLVPFGNSRKYCDSYCWNLAQLCLSDSGKGGLYDLVYLDGAHSLVFSGLGCALIKKLMKPGGLLVVDDVMWTYDVMRERDPDEFKKLCEMYTDEQMKTAQIEMVVNIFLADDPDWKPVMKTDERVVYRYKSRKP
ncbi:MAG: hypothetical protein IKI64_02765 [Clostridia bacterium]|nr:hypothetical protein [Clostridia bacterium]